MRALTYLHTKKSTGIAASMAITASLAFGLAFPMTAMATPESDLEEELATTEAELDEATHEVDRLEQEIESSGERVEEIAQQLSDKRNVTASTMKSLYKEMSFHNLLLEIILNADSFGDAITQLAALEDMHSASVGQINSLTTEATQNEADNTTKKEQLTAAQQTVESKKADVDSIKARIEEAEAERAKAAELAAQQSAMTGGALGNVAIADGADSWRDNLIYIQWGSRPEACWPIQIKTPQEVECGSVAIMMAAIMLSGDYTITPNSMLAAAQAKYGSFPASQVYKKFLQYIEEEYGVHHRSLKRGLTADQAREILAQGHMIQVGQGCEEIPDIGLPFIKAQGVAPRCSTGHTILFYKYADGCFWAKDTAPSDGAAVCLYPDGPLDITHRGLNGQHDKHAGQTESFDNYADEFLKRGWCVELWSDNPAQGPVKTPDAS